jgi:hypothetical protein
MSGFRRMIDMARSTEEVKKDLAPPCAPSPDCTAPVYPYGLCINLTEDELEKLGIDGECDVGDVIHLFAMAEVTSKSEHKSKTSDGAEKQCCRIELQITHLGLEDEDREEMADADRQERGRKRYGDDAPKETDEKPAGGGEMHLAKSRYREA